MNDRRLERLLEIYEQAAQSLRTAIALLNQGAPQVWIPSNGHKNGAGGDRKSTAYALAAKLDAARRASFQAPPTLPGVKVRQVRTGQAVADIKRRRQVSARLLAQFDKDKPKPSAAIKGARGLGSLVRRGYLRKQGTGYIRTDKPYSTDVP